VVGPFSLGVKHTELYRHFLEKAAGFLLKAKRRKI